MDLTAVATPTTVAALDRGKREERVTVAGSGPSGVRADLEEIFRRDYALVVSVAARVLGSREQAEDVAQDVFLSFNRSTVPASEARGWLSVAAAHTALNDIRSRRRRASREDTTVASSATVSADTAEAVVTLEERRRVRAALAQLPRNQAVVLLLRHSGFSYAEVAVALDLSPGSVGTVLRRAESALRKELNRDETSD